MTCYVCMEECNEKSPCECGAHVHQECLENIKKQDCTICKKELDIYIECEDPDPCEDPCDPCEDESACVIVIFVTCIFVFYVLSGWIGKSLLLMFQPVDNFLAFWTAEHIVCSFSVMIIISVLTKLISFVQYI